MRKPSVSATWRAIAVAVAVLLVPGFFQGCVGCTCEECFSHGVAMRARDDAAESYVYSAPLSTTEEALARVLAGAGREPIARPLVRGQSTTSRTTFTGEPLTIAVVPAGAGYRVHITSPWSRALPDGGREATEKRELDLEYRLASAVDPAFEAATDAKAADREERAKSVGRGCDRGCAAIGCGRTSHEP